MAGHNRERRLRDVESAAAVFRAAGVTCQLVPTAAAGSAALQASDLARAGCDAIISCGGDGTVNEAVQRIIAEQIAITVGVLPLGTGNGLAADLRMPRAPIQAAEWLLKAQPKRIAVGKAEWDLEVVASQPYAWRRSRYFLISAGVGADAELVYRATTAVKERWGMGAYYVLGCYLYFTHRFSAFDLEVQAADGGTLQTRAQQLLIARIACFGGAMPYLAPGADLMNDELRLVLFRKAGRKSILRHTIAASLNRFWNIPGVEFLSAHEVTVRPVAAPSANNLHTQIDGELLSSLPVRFSIVPNALTLLVAPS